MSPRALAQVSKEDDVENDVNQPTNPESKEAREKLFESYNEKPSKLLEKVNR